MNINDTQSIATYFDQYLTECKHIKRLRKATLVSYQEVFNNFRKSLPEVQCLRDLSPQLVMRFFCDLGSRTIHGRVGVRDATLRTYYDKLTPFFRWLETYNYIPRGSLVRNIIKPPAPKYEDEKALSKDEVARIMSAITINRINDSFLIKRDLLVVSLLAYTGIRKGELLGLKVKDIDWQERTLLVQAETSKSKKSRKIPIGSTLFMHLKTYIEERKERKFHSEQLLVASKTGNPFTESGLKYWVKYYNRVSGVSFHLHRFRHTFACELAKNNADISSIKSVMGHSSIKMTERYLRTLNSESARPYIDTLSF